MTFHAPRSALATTYRLLSFNLPKPAVVPTWQNKRGIILPAGTLPLSSAIFAFYGLVAAYHYLRLRFDRFAA